MENQIPRSFEEIFGFSPTLSSSQFSCQLEQELVTKKLEELAKRLGVERFLLSRTEADISNYCLEELRLLHERVVQQEENRHRAWDIFTDAQERAREKGFKV